MSYVTTYTYLNFFLETTGQLFKNQQTLKNYIEHFHKHNVFLKLEENVLK